MAYEFQDYEIYEFEDFEEVNPYDVTAAAEHFQTPKEFMDALDKYRIARERAIWDVVHKKIDDIKKYALEYWVDEEMWETMEDHLRGDIIGATMTGLRDAKARDGKDS